MAGIKISDSMTALQFLELELRVNSSTDVWERAIVAFSSRFQSRYFAILDRLISSDSATTSGITTAKDVPGFVILSVSFMLIETLQGFRRGVKKHNNRSGGLCSEYLKGMKFIDRDGIKKDIDEAIAKQIYETGRCALLHSSGTEGIRVKKSGPAIKKLPDGTFEINRNKFYEFVKQSFGNYQNELRNTENVVGRTNFIAKMEFISGKG